MGLIYELVVETDDGTTTLEIEADSREEALERGQDLHPDCRLALVSPHPGETKG